MRCNDQFRTVAEGEQISTKLLNGYAFSRQTAGRCGAECNDQFGPDQSPLNVIPPLAARDFVTVRTFVQSAFAADFEFEMLDRVGNEDGSAVEPGISDRAIQDSPSRAYKGMTREVFIISRLLPYHHKPCRLWTLPRHDLR